MSENNPDIPDTPPDVLARQSAARPLTPATAELIGSKSYLSEGGKMVGDGYTEMVRQNSAALKARQRAEAYAGGTPHRGLTTENVHAIKARTYEDAPALDPEMGDRTPAFVNWIWANCPQDAKVRYFPRNIWPTTLPEVWPAVSIPNSPLAPTIYEPAVVRMSQSEEIERLKSELAALKSKPALVKRTRKPRAKVRAEVQPAPATATTV